ncbi:hypothetical protein [Paenibacillus sp. PAMC21692]|uniref:hypothetical protein n=1 Tax=Paenibacillus sp. PAMC21692 TaxID=2762320 RepID=UPI00164CF573|nr:hypothetical protein [Paenibacillus sp. PAMC21692]QNK56693.1 hypothetical protein H7F31_29900 [Paenibacillus sp. PAMC21692]
MKTIGKLILLAALLTGIAMAYLPQTTFACSCAEPKPVMDAAEGAQIVFAGTVADVTETKSKRGFSIKNIQFETGTVYKGEAGTRITVWTGSGGGDCGFFFQKGMSYLVYAYASGPDGNGDEPGTGICTRTKALSQAQGDLDLLGQGVPPNKDLDQPVADSAKDFDVRLPWPALAGAVAIIAASIAIGLVLRKKRRAGR